MLRTWLRTFLFIPHCPGCETPLNSSEWDWGFCSICQESLIQWPSNGCVICGRVLEAAPPGKCGPCLVEAPALISSTSALIYGGPIRSAILRWKRRKSYGAGTHELVRLMRQLNLDPGLSVDAWVPIPPNPLHQRSRDFTPTETLASALNMKREGHPPIRCVLRETGRSGRGASGERRYRVTGEVAGLRLLLIDDVRTTGNTGNCAARALLRAGAKQVSLWTLARSPLPHEPCPFTVATSPEGQWSDSRLFPDSDTTPERPLPSQSTGLRPLPHSS